MSKWISVKDRLPEIDEEYICFCVHPNGNKMVTSLHFEEGNFTDERDMIESWNQFVTHWMPLPEPPSNKT